MNKKILVSFVALLVVSMTLTPFALAKPWNYPKKNPKFEQYGVTISFSFENLIAETYVATADLEEANKVVIVCDEQPMPGYQIRIGEEGPGQRVYNYGEDFDYIGVDTLTVWNPVLPYAFDPENALMTLFLGGEKYHFRVDYMYDFSAFAGGLSGTIKLVALVTGNSELVLGGKPMLITSLQGTGDFANVQIQATAGATGGHEGVVIGWPE